MAKLIGENEKFGFYDYKIMLILGLSSILSGMTIYSTVFIVAAPAINCQLKQAPNQPVSKDDLCKVWDSVKIQNNPNYTCFYDKSEYGSTIVTELGLVCSKEYLTDLSQSIQLFGCIMGCFSGYIGDKYGRKRSLVNSSIVFSIILVIFQFLQLPFFSISSNVRYVIYVIGQFFVGMFTNLTHGIGYVLIFELTAEKYSTLVSNIYAYFYILGEIFVLVVYYLSQEWKVLCWFITIYSIILIFLIHLYVPESPLWEKDSRKKQLSTSQTSNQKEASPAENKKTIGYYLDMLRSLFRSNLVKSLYSPKKNLFQNLIIVYVWFLCSFLYFGISLGETKLKVTSPYVIFLLSALAEAAGYASVHLSDYLGRKKNSMAYVLFTFIVFIIIAFIIQDNNEVQSISANTIIIIILFLIGKAAISGFYQHSYIYSSELYPLEIRNTAIVFLSCFGDIGAVIAPQINSLSASVWYPLTYLIYSICSLIGFIFLFFLPETKFYTFKNNLLNRLFNSSKKAKEPQSQISFLPFNQEIAVELQKI